MLSTLFTNIINIELPQVGAIYRHYSGKQYKIIAIGYHSESLKKHVVYQALYDDKQFGNQAIWIRPLEMFMETIIIDGKETKRFTKIS